MTAPGNVNPVNKIGASIASAGGATGITQFVAPGSNVRGMWVRSIEILPAGGTTFPAFLSTGPTAPTSTADFTKPVLRFSDGGGIVNPPGVTLPIFLPAGFGLWAAIQGTNPFVQVTYDLL